MGARPQIWGQNNTEAVKEGPFKDTPEENPGASPEGPEKTPTGKGEGKKT